jgi:hypothetical protein
MSLSPTAAARVQIHFCVLLWGFTAILGKLITLTALPLVWWRMLIVTVALALLPRVWRALRAMPGRLRLAYAGIGVLVALHWLTFYGSIKLANASVAATCIALAPVFLALFEPLVARTRFEPRELLLGIAVVPGVALVVGGVPDGMRLGIAIGALSAALVAVFGALNKRLVEHGRQAPEGAPRERHQAARPEEQALPACQNGDDQQAERPPLRVRLREGRVRARQQGRVLHPAVPRAALVGWRETQLARDAGEWPVERPKRRV